MYTFGEVAHVELQGIAIPELSADTGGKIPIYPIAVDGRQGVLHLRHLQIDIAAELRLQAIAQTHI